MGVTVSYKGETIASMNTGGTKTLKTAGKFCEGDITLGYVPDSPTLISKTITENGVYNASSDNADGYDVVTVGVPERNTLDELFAGTLEIANIPSAITIGEQFFLNKTALKNVIIPNVTSIGARAFDGCSNLEIQQLPTSLTSVGNYAFRNCTKLALTYLPASLTSYSYGLFNGCTSLAIAEIPNNGITIIPEHCFSACRNITISNLPTTIINIRTGAFASCLSIPFLDFSDFTQIPTIGTNAFLATNFPFYFRDQQQLDEWAAATNWSTYADRFQIKPSGVI